MPTTPLREKVAAILQDAVLQQVTRLEYSWGFNFSSASLTCEGPWRLVSEGRLVLTGYDHGHRFGLPEPIDAEAEASNRLLNRRIRSATVDAETADLHLTFEDGSRLELLSVSVGYEAWQLNTEGSCIVAAAEGRLSEARYVQPNLMVGGPWE